MLQLAIIGILTALFAVVVSSWSSDKNPGPPANPIKTPPKPGTPSKPNPSQPEVSAMLISNPPLLQKNNKGKYELIAAYKTNQIFNPRNGQWDQLVLRGYLTKSSLFNKNSALTTGIRDELVGPQIRVKQGETLKINLNNQLPDESPESCEHITDINIPHCFNTTNLHTHGFWVSPQGNSDNVFLRVSPQTNLDYQYKIEANHPAGTYWYHAHLHGSTAIQVSSGMAGPLIVEGIRTPKVKNGKVTATGDLDILWKNQTKNNSSHEKVLVFQQIQYDCINDQGTSINSNNCEGSAIGVMENYSGLNSFNAWGLRNYSTSINGKVLGEIQANQNEYQRWRMIHGGVRDTLGLIIKELPQSQKLSAEQTIQACSEYQDSSRKEDFDRLTSLPVYTLAQDGLTMTEVQTRRLSVFHPGYRHDAMLSFPTTNKYCIFDVQLNINDQINNIPLPGQVTPQISPQNQLNAQLLGWVNVKSSKTKAQTAAQFLKEQAQKIGLAKEIQNQLAQLNLAAFNDHPSLMTPAIDRLVQQRPKQLSTFDASFGPNARFGYRLPEVNGIYRFGEAFSGEDALENKYVRKLQIGQTDEWILTSNNLNHPYHIHVNPFQIVKVLDSDGNDVSTLTPDPDVPVNLEDVQYRGLKGQFKDTILVKQNYEVVIRSHYKKFEGDFVQHCHILDHEDQGMMEYVRICGDKFNCNAPLPDAHAHH